FNDVAYDKKVDLTILTEALCIDCQRFFVNQLYPLLTNLNSIINFDIVPYGNAHIKDGKIICQHGEEECKINKYHSCMIDVIKHQYELVSLLYCTEKLLMEKNSFEVAKTRCYAEHSIDRALQNEIEYVSFIFI
ncbi:unnamed protein product, partial [Strongylus vulgaris]